MASSLGVLPQDVRTCFYLSSGLVTLRFFASKVILDEEMQCEVFRWCCRIQAMVDEYIVLVLARDTEPVLLQGMVAIDKAEV
jgi:hypothetical protein